MSISLSVITVTHEHRSYLNKYLAALLPELEACNAEAIWIDNCSQDGCAEVLTQLSLDYLNQLPPERAKKLRSRLTLHRNQRRYGFSVNNNYGMAIAQGRYLLLLNPDTEVQPGALATLVQFLDQYPTVGLCGAQLRYPDGTIQPSPRRFPTISSVLARRSPLRRFLQTSRFNQRHLMQDLDHTEAQPVDWLLGACMCVRREVLATAGPLDEGFFLYVEDIDWAKRIHSSGWEVYYVPQAQIIHHHLAVSDHYWLSRSMWRHFLSMIRYARKHLLPPIPGLAIRRSRFEVWQRSQESHSNFQL